MNKSEEEKKFPEQQCQDNQVQQEKKKKKKKKKNPTSNQQPQDGTKVEQNQQGKEEKKVQEQKPQQQQKQAPQPKDTKDQAQPKKKKQKKKQPVDNDYLLLQQFAQNNKQDEEEKINNAKDEPSEIKHETGMNFLPYTQDEIKNATFIRAQDNSTLRCINNWKDGKTTQTYPPTLTIGKQFPDQLYPEGILVEYKDCTRSNNAEKKEIDKLFYGQLSDLRKAAEAHRQIRKYAQSICRPGIKLFDFCEKVEEALRYIIDAKQLDAGIAFPTGVSLNHVAAHYTPNGGDSTILQYDDVMKFDLGVHVNGRIIDSAFTIAFNPQYDPLLEAVKDATNTGVRESGIDARFSEIGEAIQEAMESYEVTINNKLYPVHCVRNLNGHLIGNYQIHAGKSVPIVKGGSSVRMEEGELYAIETFGTTGKGLVFEDLECSHYMKEQTGKQAAIRNPKSKFLLKYIENNFGTLCFCRRWLDRDDQKGHLIALKGLVESGLVEPYYPLCDVTGSYIAQFEHTLFLRPTCKEILSAGEDF